MAVGPIVRHHHTKHPVAVYILACADDTFYAGMSRNLYGRLSDHVNGSGSQQTMRSKPILLVAYWEFQTSLEASQWEAFFIQKLREKHPSTFYLSEILALYQTRSELLRGFGRQVTGVLCSEV